MKKKTIQEQVAELTEEQKETILQKGKKFNIFSFIQLGIYVAVASTWSFFMMLFIIPVKARYEELGRQVDELPLPAPGRYDLIEEWIAAGDFHTRLLMIWYGLLLVMTIALVVLTVIRISKFKKQYPFYSDKKYTYLKKNWVQR